jgi:hypothetical protein
MPAIEADRLYFDRVAGSLLVREHQERAMQRGMPSILISSGRMNGPLAVTPEMFDALVEEQFLSNVIPWLQGWIDWSRKEDAPVRVHWVRYADSVANLQRTVRGICRTLANAIPRSPGSLRASASTRSGFIS